MTRDVRSARALLARTRPGGVRTEKPKPRMPKAEPASAAMQAKRAATAGRVLREVERAAAPTCSWWCGLGRGEFAERRRQEQARMSASRFGKPSAESARARGQASGAGE